MQEPATVLALLVLAALVVAVVILVWRLWRARESARTNEAAAAREQMRQIAAHERSERAIAGETGAPALLASAGYEVLARQVAGSWTVRANGEPKTFGLRADYLVSRGGRRLIAEVKTGRIAPSLAHGGTRRQLLEYGAAFDVEGVLLVDADRGTITHVEIDLFAGRAPAPATPTGSHGLWLGALLVVATASFGAGIVIGAAMTRAAPPQAGTHGKD